MKLNFLKQDWVDVCQEIFNQNTSCKFLAFYTASAVLLFHSFQISFISRFNFLGLETVEKSLTLFNYLKVLCST